MIGQWLVRHNDGYCICDRQPPNKEEFSVPTKCGCFIVLPLGFTMDHIAIDRKLICQECEAAVAS
jgi:hypothetical protein